LCRYVRRVFRTRHSSSADIRSPAAQMQDV
jgi:hypothetical protein